MKKVKLGDVLDVRRGTSLAGEYYSEQGNLIRLTLGNFNYPRGGFQENTAKKDIYFVGSVNPAFILKAGDIITPLTEQVSGLLGETATIPESGKYIQSGDIGLVVPDETKIDKRFAYYLVASPIVRKQLDAAAQQTKIRHTSPDAIKACEAWIPENISTQQSIGKFLDALNAKITLNKKINATLEAMAKTLYDYWFVQFDFPDEHSKPYKTSGGKMVYGSELGRDIPAGWKVGTLEDFATYATKKISSEKIPRNRYIATDNMLPNAQGVTVSQYEPSESSVHEFTSGDVLLANIRPHFKKVWLAHFSGGCSSDVLVIRPKNFSEAEYIFSTLSRDDFFSYDVAGAKGTKMPRGDKVHIMSYPMLINNDLIERYVAFVRPMYFKLCKLHLESRRLAALRDWLLPMLMNGQIEFKEA